jgi:transcriptional repressor NrdR
VEEVQILDLTVVKRTGGREPYAREKVLAGIKKAFEKRPLTKDDLDRLVQIIEQDIQILRKPEVTSQEIGEIVMRRLKRVDEVAFIRFASVYQAFSDAAAFHRAILRLTPSRMRRLLPKRKKHAHKKA